MVDKKLTILLLCSYLFWGCATYNTFYGETATVFNFDKKSKRLDIGYQDLKELPSGFDRLEELRMLNLSGNKDLDIEAVLAVLPNPEELEVLILDSLNLEGLPKNLEILVNLKQLSLAYNPKLGLKEVFEHLKEIPLEFLNLKGNRIERLPVNIVNIKSLKDLNLSFNRLQDKASYTYLGSLPKLSSIWIDHNELYQLPETLGELQQLNRLYADGNYLEELPKEMANMKNLKVLHLGFNHFKEFPAVFIRVPKLLMVHINNNSITSFPREYETESYALLALLLDNNPIPTSERRWAEKTFSKFFLLSFEQEIKE